MKLPIYGGAEALIDDELWPLVSGRAWRLNRRKDGSPSGVMSGSAAKGTLVLLHRVLMDAPKGAIVDHINGDVLDNRRHNLRLCSHADNMKNRRRAKSNRSGFKGVYWSNTAYCAEIKVNGTKYRLGRFGTAERAHQAYARAAKLFHGEFARLN